MPKTIMIVDDEESLRELVCAILEPEGFNLVTASDGNECLNKLKTVKPDLILLDMMMPGMSGRETCEKIRANPKTKNIKVAFLTVAKLSEGGKETLEKMNISDYITKPFDNSDLVNRVKKIVGN
ncbi:MAG: response regulator [Candidatus Aenigmarchaeota archaeon]|nr:response regulator [Candidatus Aenigmarchaeota archaeon]